MNGKRLSMYTKRKRACGCQIKPRLVEDNLDRKTTNNETKQTGHKKALTKPGLQ